MAVRQLAEDVGAFAHFLREVEARLVPGEGWYGVFATRDPEGLRACFAGADILPWDVVEALLQDLGEPPGGERAVRARALHTAAAAAHDRRPGGAEALRERRILMDRERRDAEARARDLAARLRAAPSTETARLSVDLAWIHDDHARATSRVAELTARLAALPAGDAGRPEPPPRSAGFAPASAPPRDGGRSAPTPAPSPDAA
ncbi:UL36 very large tegument protein, partial [Streptomyces sp. NPDC048629]